MCTWSKLTGDGILPNGFNDHTQVLFYGFMFHYWLIYLVKLYHIWYNVYINVQYTRYVTTCSVRVPILSRNLMLFSQWQLLIFPTPFKCQCKVTLQWRHNGRDIVSNHQPHECLLNRLFRRRSKKTSKLRVTGLCVGNSPVTGEFHAQMASNEENVSIWWRHHDQWEVHPAIPHDPFFSLFFNFCDVFSHRPKRH